MLLLLRSRVRMEDIERVKAYKTRRIPAVISRVFFRRPVVTPGDLRVLFRIHFEDTLI